MKRKLILVCCLTLSLAHASFFNSLFGTKSKHNKRNSSQAMSVDFKKEASLYQQFCKTESTIYGYKIKCNPSDNIVSFKADASATVKCIQMVNGSGDYPLDISISKDYIKSLKLCQQAVVYGPNTLHRTQVEQNGANLVSRHSSTMYFDVVCNNQNGFESTLYVKQQQAYTALNNKAISQCQELSAPETKKFIVMFYICIGFALIAFGIFLYKKYKK